MNLHGLPAVKIGAWLATLGVDLYLSGSLFWILGADAGVQVGFLAFAGLITVVKALAWANDWKFLGVLAAVLSIFCTIAFAVGLYAAATPPPTQHTPSAYEVQLNKTADGITEQLTLPDLSKESRVALLDSQKVNNQAISDELSRQREAIKAHLTTRIVFDSMYDIPKAPGSEGLMIIFFLLLGVLLEITIYRITPRIADIPLEEPKTAQPYVPYYEEPEEETPHTQPVQYAYRSTGPRKETP